MKNLVSVFLLLATFSVSVSGQRQQRESRTALASRMAVPTGIGQLETPPGLFDAGVDELGRSYLLNGQPAVNSKLILTASNGFFDNGACVAKGQSSLPKVGDDDLIQPNFAYLGDWKKADSPLRWYVWLPEPGRVYVKVNMNVAQPAAGSKIKVQLASETRTVSTVASSPDVGQPWELVFECSKPGQHTLSLTALSVNSPKSGVGELHTIDIYGPAIQEAQLLRARWRPAAVHAGYSCSSIKQSRMWVMTTRSVCEFSSYSPITTPFGYYGTSFDADRRSNGSFNFSMWAASAKGKVPPLEQMPHLLAAGSPEAEFSGFGHEGSGVKLRGWTPMPDRPEVCVQALRVESDEKYDTYFSHFWDHPTRQWKLYAVGRKWNGGKTMLHLHPGSFCEVPGPPHVERTGDRVREVVRHGWHLGDDQQWHAMDTFDCKSSGVFNKVWHTTSDGEFSMMTGGMRYYKFEKPPVATVASDLPEFLLPKASRQLYNFPAEAADIAASQIGGTTAVINLKMARAGTNAKADVYYGETDCLTFAKRTLHSTERNSEVSQTMQDAERTWTTGIHISNLRNGDNKLVLKNLKPNTTYYYRILVTNDEGRIWTFTTLSFHTTK